jgi:hypothetical protein
VEGRVNLLCEEEQFKLLSDVGKDHGLQPSLLEHTGSVDGGSRMQKAGECNNNAWDGHGWREIGTGKADEDGLVVPD